MRVAHNASLWSDANHIIVTHNLSRTQRSQQKAPNMLFARNVLTRTALNVKLHHHSKQSNVVERQRHVESLVMHLMMQVCTEEMSKDSCGLVIHDCRRKTVYIVCAILVGSKDSLDPNCWGHAFTVNLCGARHHCNDCHSLPED